MRKFWENTSTLNPYIIRPNEIKSNDSMGYKIIAVIDGPFWSAFYGPTNWPDYRIASEGEKLAKETAELLFPAIVDSGREYYSI